MTGKWPRALKQPDVQKLPKAVAVPQTTRVPTAKVSLSQFDLEVPRWRLGGVDWGGPWAWHRATSGHMQHVFEGLKAYESMTFGAISQKTSCGPFPSEKVSGPAQCRLAQISRDDETELFKLRITKKGRVWAIQRASELWLLWWDPFHTVYPSKE